MMFSIYALKKYVSDASHKINYKDLKIQDISYINKLLKILDTKMNVLRTKTFLMSLEESHSRRSHWGGD